MAPRAVPLGAETAAGKVGLAFDFGCEAPLLGEPGGHLEGARQAAAVFGEERAGALTFFSGRPRFRVASCRSAHFRTSAGEPTVYGTERDPEVLAAYRREFPNHKIVLLQADNVAKGINIEDDLPPAPARQRKEDTSWLSEIPEVTSARRAHTTIGSAAYSRL